jgi:transcription-repair coupling factor (superfamily II helicase)
MLAERLFASQALWPATELLDGRRDAAVAVPLSARAFLTAAAFARRPQTMLVVVAGEEAAQRTVRDIAAWLGREAVLHLPLRTDTPWGAMPRSVDQCGQRNQALWALASGAPVVVVASARSLLRAVPAAAAGGDSLAFQPLRFALGQSVAAAATCDGLTPAAAVGDESARLHAAAATCDDGVRLHTEALPLSALASELSRRGYERLERLEGPGSFVLRGDVLDIFGAAAAYPVRVEFFDDEVEAIRRIVPSTNQTIGDLPATEVFAAREFIVDEAAVRRLSRAAYTASDMSSFPRSIREDLESFEQGREFRAAELYLPWLYERTSSPLAWLHPAALVVLQEPRALFDDVAHYYEDVVASAAEHRARLDGLYLPPAELDFGSQQRLTLLSLMHKGATPNAQLDVRHANTSGSEERLVATVRAALSKRSLTIVCEPDRRVRESLKLALSDAHIAFENAPEAGQTAAAPVADAAPTPPPTPNIALIASIDLPTSLILPQAALALITLADVAARQTLKSARSRRSIDITQITFPFKPGDYVVHETHGIALFRDMVRQEIDGVERDYLYLEYAQGDKLFTPVENIAAITRFVGPEGKAPRLTRLNTADWSRATGKARKAARQLAFDLVDLYSRRSTAAGFAFPPDTPAQYEMELLFAYDETPDQIQAIADVKADMESPRPMDRLICGDVGFGKTEVALRAAFKAVQGGKQVMLLCPTTILAQQHYTTFSERLEPFAVQVEVLSRFRSGAQQKATLAAVAAGRCDVLIGTHRLLSADVNPKRLGLVIIDEEQRFGVQHKEQLKNLREQIDVLTLSATPIPRTLQMALSGVRDLSLIDTPPAARTPVEVHVGEWDEDLVSAAIRRELARGGQVYYVSNRVRSIDDAVARVVAAAPEARIAVAHGKLSEHELEAVMERFAANQIDVLVATTIIESGLDNPHTNTLIIEDSQRLGLAQLYQLKGRVGRSHAQAWAYFLFPSAEALTDTAADRLSALTEHRDLGSGMRIALRDLEIRGAGSLLGAEQSGNLAAVGFDLFANMLQEAVEQTRALPTEAHPEVRIDLPLHFYLPEEYIAAADERVTWYRRIAAIASLADAEAYHDRLQNDYGALPAPAANLVNRARAKVLAAESGVETVGLVRGKLSLEPVTLNAEQRAWAKQHHATYFATSHRLIFPVSENTGALGTLIELLQSLGKLLRSDEESPEPD